MFTKTKWQIDTIFYFPISLQPDVEDLCYFDVRKYEFSVRTNSKTLQYQGQNLNFRAGSTFPFQVCTVRSSMDRTSRCNKVDAVRLYASYMFNLLLLKGQICVSNYSKLLITSCLLKIIEDASFLCKEIMLYFLYILNKNIWC